MKRNKKPHLVGEMNTVIQMVKLSLPTITIYLNYIWWLLSHTFLIIIS